MKYRSNKRQLFALFPMGRPKQPYPLPHKSNAANDKFRPKGKVETKIKVLESGGTAGGRAKRGFRPSGGYKTLPPGFILRVKTKKVNGKPAEYYVPAKSNKQPLKSILDFRSKADNNDKVIYLGRNNYKGPLSLEEATRRFKNARIKRNDNMLKGISAPRKPIDYSAASKKIKNNKDEVKYLPMRRRQQLPADAFRTSAQVLGRTQDYLDNGKNVTSTIEIGATADINNPEKLVPMSAEHDKARVVLSNSATDRVIHKTHFKTGQPSTRSLLALAKSEGTVYKTMYDSKIQHTAEANRNTMTFGAGFNSRTWHTPCVEAHFHWDDLNEATMNAQNTTGSDWTTFGFENQTALYAALLTKEEFLFHNQAASLPAYLKIHCVRIKKNDLMYEVTGGTAKRPIHIVERCGGSTSGQLNRAIPAQYLHAVLGEQGTDALSTSKTRTMNAFTSLQRGGDITRCRFFKENCELVNTFTKKLAPGDFWKFTHTHHFGPGIDQALLNEKNYGQDLSLEQVEFMPVSYAYIFETHGTLCEGYLARDAVVNYDQFTGKSPTFISYEFKKSYLGVLEKNESVIAPTQPKANQRTLRRFFITDPNFLIDGTTALVPNNAAKELWVLNSNIAQSRAAANAAGIMYIPTMTTAVTSETSRTGGNNL